MAIWSLTQERVDKLLSKIRETENELDILIKTAPKDIWRRDLDEFLTEWKVQLEQEAKNTKKRSQMGRRASAKLKIGGKDGGKKRRPRDSDGYSDSDVGPPKAKKSSANRVQPKSSSLMNYLGTTSSNKPATKSLVNAVEQKPVARPPAETAAIVLDGAAESKEAVLPKPEKNKTAPKVTKNIDLSDDSDDMDDEFMDIAKEANAKRDVVAPARNGRAARAKPAKYVLSDNTDSDGDDMLGDVSTMVKGIGSKTVETGRPLFSASASRPSSAHGLPKTVGRPSRGLVDTSSGADETDYAKLAPQDSPHRPAIRPTKPLAMSGDDDSDDNDDLAPPPKSKAASIKGANKVRKPLEKTVAPASKPKPKNAAGSYTSGNTFSAHKQITMSPTAKAYVKQQAKAQSVTTKIASKKKVVESDSDDGENSDHGVDVLAHELISDEDGPSKTNARPGRRAVASKAKYAMSDDDTESDEEDFDDDDNDDDDMTD